LSLTKEQILFNCKKENINFIEDSSNKNEFYIRNYIRLQIIPKFKTINPNYQLAFNRIIDYFLNIKFFFDQEIQKII
jgi:tRNA(Ile)-lysidine synthase